MDTSRRLDAATRTRLRWQLAALPESDPHHIPAQRRRIGSRAAVRMLAHAYTRAQDPRTALTVKAILQYAIAKANAVKRAERTYSEYRKLRRQREHGQWANQPTSQFWHGKYAKPLRLRPPKHPVDLLSSAIAWLAGKRRPPPGVDPWRSSPPGIADLAMLDLMQAKMQIMREERPEQYAVELGVKLMAKQMVMPGYTGRRR